MIARAALAVVAVVAAAACNDDTDPRWQLHHDRIVAIRSTPAHIPAGQLGVLDALVTSVDAGPAVHAPATAAISEAPTAITDAVRPDGQGGWLLISPDEAALAAARTELALAPGAPVPVELTTTFEVGGSSLVATKRVWFGDARDNPTVGSITVAGAPVTGSITVPFDQDVALAIDQATTDRVNWLTSCGSLNVDDNEHTVVLHVDDDDRMEGQLVVTVRDDRGGVAWQIWPIETAPHAP